MKELKKFSSVKSVAKFIKGRAFKKLLPYLLCGLFSIAI